MRHVVNRRVAWMAIALLVALASTPLLSGQQSSTSPDPDTKTTAEDHQNMMMQLGIKKLRPGPSGNESAPNHANYDEAKANPFPILPDALTLENGKKVTTAEAWWKERRPQIVEAFEREVIGRVPRNVPKVNWSVVNSTAGLVGKYPVVGRQLVGHVENAVYPSITVDVQMALVTPADAIAPVPVMMMFGSGTLPQSVGGPAPPAGRGGPLLSPSPGSDLPATEQLIAAG